MVDGRDSESSATLKNILDLLSNNTDEEIKIILSKQDNVEETIGNTLAQKYVEEIKLHFKLQVAGMEFTKQRFYKTYIRINKTFQAWLPQISLFTSMKILKRKILLRRPIT